MDTPTKTERSRRMARVCSMHTKPELKVRSLVEKLNLRFELHDWHLPGRPDIIFRRKRKAIFIHGCFWHRHFCRNGQRLPKSRVEFWQGKLQANKKRDAKNYRRLNREGWHYMVVWECQLKESRSLKQRIQNFFRKK